MCPTERSQLTGVRTTTKFRPEYMVTLTPPAPSRRGEAPGVSCSADLGSTGINVHPRAIAPNSRRSSPCRSRSAS